MSFNVADADAVSGVRFRIKYDDGFVAYLNGTEIARGNAPGIASWNSAATALHDDGAAVVFEEHEPANGPGALRDGDNVLAIHGLNDNLGSSDFLILPELDLLSTSDEGSGERNFFVDATPGAPNFSGAPSVSAIPVISEASGTRASSFDVTISADDPEADIRYTTNGSEPTESSTLYSGPISITTTTRLSAKSFTPGTVDSPTVTETYLFLSSTVRNATSDVALIVADTFGSGIGSGGQTPTYAALYDVDPITGRASFTAEPDAQHHAALKQRGSSSSGFPKKQYAFEIWSAPNGDDMDVPLLGMPAESDWVLYAPYSDKSLMRNVLSYDWSNRIGLYASRTRFCELYLNTGTGRVASSDYDGVYVLIEKIKRDGDRVDIARLLGSDNTGEDVTGGYILKIDRLDPGDNGFTVSSGLRLAYVYPKEDRVTSQQASYIRGYINQFESALNGANFTHPTNGYRRYIDENTFIDHHIMVELTKNIDGFRLSTYMYKDKNDKLKSGPIWDYNLSLGNADYNNGWITSGWYYSLLSGNAYAWYPRLFQDRDFVQQYVDRWTSYRAGPFMTSELLASVDAYAAEINESQARNFDEWNILGSRVWPNWYIADTWIEEIDWMKGWITGRAQWMDSQFESPVSISRRSGVVNSGTQVTMSSDNPTIYYTLNGTDPRLSGGSTSPDAIAYDGALTIDENTRVIARVRRSAARWSAPTDETFYITPPRIGISEIHYNPAAGPIDSTRDRKDYEFVELVNFGSEPIDLGVVRLDGAVRFSFADGDVQTLNPAEHVVIVSNLEAFESRYDTTNMLIAGQYAGNLSNFSETLTAFGPGDMLLREVSYSDQWYPDTDGAGSSLVIVDAWGTGEAWSVPASWRASTDVGGSPGVEDPGGNAGGLQLPGDSNQDGRLNIADTLTFLLHLFGGTARSLPCEGEMGVDGNLALFDVNGDGGVDVADGVYTLSYLFQNGPPPTAGETCVRMVGCPSVCTF